MKTARLQAAPLTAEAFAPFGQVIEVGGAGKDANQGTARRFDYLAKLANLREKAKPNLAAFRVQPAAFPLKASMVERHPFSSQAFIPLSASRYLVTVCPDGKDGRPDTDRLAVFIASSNQGINYNAGTWHHPLMGLDAPADFAMLVWEDGTAGDCQLVELPEPVHIDLP